MKGETGGNPLTILQHRRNLIMRRTTPLLAWYWIPAPCFLLASVAWERPSDNASSQERAPSSHEDTSSRSVTVAPLFLFGIKSKLTSIFTRLALSVIVRACVRACEGFPQGSRGTRDALQSYAALSQRQVYLSRMPFTDFWDALKAGDRSLLEEGERWRVVLRHSRIPRVSRDPNGRQQIVLDIGRALLSDRKHL